ncbi:endoplasmic reticulum protein 44 [Dermatophagoides farinae]|uniref:Endoplasmic reticulum resident protein 44 n=1 Tax=Dermatophagoides farinae TaxID=6954 RepID=A0A922HYQ6_DERFA|nr:endoplasmic reticulum resident protein 44-like [Dermatophagoides farinae]KAH7646178.1 thioredoxin domain-containing protein [Dermatophagoides farinae]KAH9516558.1 Endoplasmic reticulum resident protein 44 [Dermatophagoides farinae]
MWPIGSSNQQTPNVQVFYRKFPTKIIAHCLLIALSWLTKSANANVVSLTSNDFDAYTSHYELVFLNFYADWCRFSQLLAPIFEEVSKKITIEFPDEGKVLFAKIDCEHESALGQRFHITKYPTLKVMLNGKLLKREYRGQRSSEAMAQYLRDLLKDPIIPINSYDELNKIDEKKGAIMTYFRSEAGFQKIEYDLLRKVARDLRDDCKFYWVTGPPVDKYSTAEKILSIKFKPSRSSPSPDDLEFPTDLKSYDELSTWATDKCIPLVREITFENAEELTEEGLPFLILFHHPDDKHSVELYTKTVNQELLSESGSINFLLADGVKFAHPLMHLGKTPKDLPLVAIDSFRHMYMFPNFDDIRTPGKLKQFIQELYSGKLHREFHFGPDPTSHDHHGDGHNQLQTQPPESTFAKLAPSKIRYTLLKDEL